MTSLFSRRRFLAAVATLPVVGQLVRKPDELGLPNVRVDMFCQPQCLTVSAIGSILSASQNGTRDLSWITISFTMPGDRPMTGVTGLSVHIHGEPVWYCGIPTGVTLLQGEIVLLSFPVNAARLARGLTDYQLGLA